MINKKWVVIFRALGNANRMKIIGMLSRGKSMNVTEIAQEIKISLKSTSKNLLILQNLDVLESEGKNGHVWYRLNRSLPKELKRAINLFC